MLCAGPQLISVMNCGVPVPAGVIVAYEGAVASIPAGWHLCNGTNGTPDLSDRFVIGADATHAVGMAGGGNAITATCSTDGAHSGPASSKIETAGETASGIGGTLISGGHAHALIATVDWVPPHYTLVYIKAVLETVLPAGAVVWSVDAAAPAGWSVQANAKGRFIRGVGDDTRQSGGAGTATYALASAIAGSHTHKNATTGLDYGGGQASYSVPARGEHVHADTPGSVSVPQPPYLALLCIRSTVTGKVKTRMVMAYDGVAASIPTGWRLCDGTNGTPDLRGRLPLGSDPDTGLAIGAVGGSEGTVSITGAIAAVTITHNHWQASGGQDDQPMGGYHDDYIWTHGHTYSGTITPRAKWYAAHFITPAS
ncbi:MAG: hypothetical protein H7Z12_15070 [Rhodospirillaceae bacterium]|nr:hypothetical protein [Rhodospirillales bacterium]